MRSVRCARARKQAEKACRPAGRFRGNRRRRFGWTLLTGWLAVTAVSAAPVTIAILRDGDAPFFTQMAEWLKTELDVLTAGEWELHYLEGPEFNAQWDPARAGDILQAALSDTNIHLLFTDGLLVSRQAIQSPVPLNKPVISGFVDDPGAPGLPISETQTSAVSNYTFVVAPCDAEADVRLFRELVPFTRLAILTDEYYLEHLPEWTARAARYEEETGIRMDLVPYGVTAGEALAGLPEDTEAVYLTPSVILDEAELGKLIEAINERKLPTFSMSGLADVERGVLAGQRSSDPTRVVRRLALNIQQILLGAAPESLPVVVDDPLRTVLNARTARQIGADLPYGPMLTAQILHGDEMEIGQPLNLAQAYRLALEWSPAVAGGQAEVQKAAEDRNRIKSALFPQVSGKLQAAQIDEDRARASMGLQPRKSTSGGAELTQVIFNDPVISGFRASSRLYQSKRFEQASLESDTLADVGQAYINLLSRHALLQIDVDNYNLIQKSLDLARSRHRSGVAGPEEIYRWESQLTSARSSLLRSHAQVSIAQTRLNQAMGTDITTTWNPADEPELVGSNPFLEPDISDVISSDRRFHALSSFLLEMAMRNSPELQALDFAIEAETILLNQYRRNRITPAIGFSLDVEHTFDETFATTGEPEFITVPESNDDNWTAAVVASWPLWEGGGKSADIRKSRAEIRRLRKLREQTAQAVEQRLYEALYSASSSSPNIELTRQAAELARKNLGVVQEKYARGAVSIVELLDAQNEVFQQEQWAVLAKYEFMLDVLRTQRAMNWMPELKSADERSAWMAELNENLYKSQEVIP